MSLLPEDLPPQPLDDHPTPRKVPQPLPGAPSQDEELSTEIAPWSIEPADRDAGLRLLLDDPHPDWPDHSQWMQLVLMAYQGAVNEASRSQDRGGKEAEPSLAMNAVPPGETSSAVELGYHSAAIGDHEILLRALAIFRDVGAGLAKTAGGMWALRQAGKERGQTGFGAGHWLPEQYAREAKWFFEPRKEVLRGLLARIKG